MDEQNAHSEHGRRGFSAMKIKALYEITRRGSRHLPSDCPQALETSAMACRAPLHVHGPILSLLHALTHLHVHGPILSLLHALTLPSHICTGTRLTPLTSARGVAAFLLCRFPHAPLPHLH